MYPECCSLNNRELLLPSCLFQYIAKELTYHIEFSFYKLWMVISLQPVLLSWINLDLSHFVTNYPLMLKKFFIGAYIGNISNAYLTVDNLASALTDIIQRDNRPYKVEKLSVLPSVLSFWHADNSTGPASIKTGLARNESCVIKEG